MSSRFVVTADDILRRHESGSGILARRSGSVGQEWTVLAEHHPATPQANRRRQSPGGRTTTPDATTTRRTGDVSRRVDAPQPPAIPQPVDPATSVAGWCEESAMASIRGWSPSPDPATHVAGSPGPPGSSAGWSSTRRLTSPVRPDRAILPCQARDRWCSARSVQECPTYLRVFPTGVTSGKPLQAFRRRRRK